MTRHSDWPAALAAPRAAPETMPEATASVLADKAAPSFGLGDNQGQLGAPLLHAGPSLDSTALAGAPLANGLESRCRNLKLSRRSLRRPAK